MFQEISTEIKNLKPSGVILRSEPDPDYAGEIDPNKLKDNQVMKVVHEIVVKQKEKEGENK